MGKAIIATPYPDEVGAHFISPFFCLGVNMDYERKRLEGASSLLRDFGVKFPHPVPGLGGMENGACFQNATKLAGVKGLVYCEGFVSGEDIHTGEAVLAMHAWAYDPALGVTIDPTGSFYAVPAHAVYVGIPFRTVYVKSVTFAQQYYGFLSGHPVKGYAWGPFKDPASHWLHPCWNSMERFHGEI